MVKKLISIIVTVYNIEKYIERCLNSLVSQTYDRIEIIIINDGSTDSSLKVCEKFEQSDKRIILITTKNRGVSKARNHAINICKGEYITIVDGDDYISNDYIEMLFKDLVNNKADIAACSWQNILENKSHITYSPKKECIILSKEEALRTILYQELIDFSPWGLLYKKSLFNEIRFPEGEIFEDLAILYKIFERANIVTYRDDKIYYYTIRKSGIILSKFNNEKMILIKNAQDMLIFIKNKYPNLEAAATSRLVRANFHILLQIPIKKENYRYINIINENIKKYREVVLKDKNAKRGTKIALLISRINIKLLMRLKRLKFMGKK